MRRSEKEDITDPVESKRVTDILREVGTRVKTRVS